MDLLLHLWTGNTRSKRRLMRGHWSLYTLHLSTYSRTLVQIPWHWQTIRMNCLCAPICLQDIVGSSWCFLFWHAFTRERFAFWARVHSPPPTQSTGYGFPRYVYIYMIYLYMYIFDDYWCALFLTSTYLLFTRTYYIHAVQDDFSLGDCFLAFCWSPRGKVQCCSRVDLCKKWCHRCMDGYGIKTSLDWNSYG